MSNFIARHVIVSLILHVLFVAWLRAHGTDPRTLAILLAVAVTFTAATSALVADIWVRRRGSAAAVTAGQAGFWATVNLIDRLPEHQRARAAAALEVVAAAVDTDTAVRDTLRVCRRLGPINRRRYAAAVARCEANLPGSRHVLYACLAHDTIDRCVFDLLTEGWFYAGLPIYCPTPARRKMPAGRALEATA